MARIRRFLISIAIVAALWLLVLVGLALADPENARLDVIPNPTEADVGDCITVTVRLQTMEVTETFRSWNVRLGYNTSVLEVADYTFPSEFWEGCLFVTPAFNENLNDVYFGEACFGGDSGSTTPFLLATIVFTVTDDGYSDFVVVTTDIDNDTSFVRPDTTKWQPGQINVTQSTLAVTLTSFAANRVPAGTGLWAILLGLVVAILLGIWVKTAHLTLPLRTRPSSTPRDEDVPSIGDA